MRAVTDKNMAELLLQMRFMPTEKKRAQLEAAEQLAGIIDDAGQYPLEFIWYRITGHRPRSIPDGVIPGDRLREQLLCFIARLSNQIAQPMAQCGQKVYSKEQLAQKFKVSTKTIERWRHRGLVARKFVFPDGRKRLGFTEESVRRFSEAEPELVEKAGAFERLTEAQRSRIIARAEQLAQTPNSSPHSVIAQIAAETDRAHETVRCILAEHDKAHPGKAICSSKNSALTPGQAAEIFRLYQQSTPVAELMRRFDRSKSTIYRVIKHKRGRAILGCRLEYIASEEFDRPDAEQAILGKALEADHCQTLSVPQQTGESLKKYLKTIRNSPALNREAEQELFRRYNFLKYLVCKHRRELAGGDFSGKMLSMLEDYLGRAERIKNLLVESNLGIVVSVANRHAGAGHSLADLISEGNFSLLRAVEKFDYRRGNRFRTYAWLVIAKDFARKIPAERSRPDKAGGMDVEGIEQRLRWTVGRELAAIEQARANLVAVVRDNLDQRSQYIIFNHFGLLSTGIRKQTKTLQQIGTDLGLTKERVRQLELQALQRLKHYVSQEEFELLTS